MSRLSSQRQRSIHPHVVALLVASQVALLAFQAWRDSPTWDEVAHFAAGLDHWRTGRFEMYCVNPPLVRTLALAPDVCLHPYPEWTRECEAAKRSTPRPEFAIGRLLAAETGSSFFARVSVARLACIPLSLLGATVCWFWTRELFGPVSGDVALACWTFSPTLLAYGHLIVPDMGAAALGLTAAYAFRHWMKSAAWQRAAMAGAALGFALLTKTTLVVLVPCLLLLWIVWRALEVPRRPWIRRELPQVLVILALAVLTLNAGYNFEGTFKPLREYRFASGLLRGTDVSSTVGDTPVGSRFRHSILGTVKVPLPESFLLGLDLQRLDFEKRLWSYLNGEWRLGGWWYYYLYAMAAKEPLGTGALALLALTATIFSRAYRLPLREELFLIIPPFAIIALVSSQTGFNHHMRYVLPAFPFFFILIARVGRCVALRNKRFSAFVFLALGWSALSSLSVFPHSLSYFNELAGGPKGGHWHLGNSNADWGQDLLYLKSWVRRHSEAQPLHLAYNMQMIDPRQAGIDWLAVPAGPLPGWYAISVNQLHDRTHRYDFFNDLKPVDWVGYTMPVYHITFDDANRLRRKYGMPELPASATEPADNLAR